MKTAKSPLGVVAQPKRAVSLTLSIILLITFISGCSSVINNSENFYKDTPRRRINWREYLTD